MITYVKFSECNDWEGETWHFYIPVPGNEQALKELKLLIDKNGFDDAYTIGNSMLTEEEVDILIKHTDQGYMNFHNKLNGVLQMKKLEKAFDEDDDPLYKGGIAYYLTEPSNGEKTRVEEVQEQETEEGI